MKNVAMLLALLAPIAATGCHDHGDQPGATADHDHAAQAADAHAGHAAHAEAPAPAAAPAQPPANAVQAEMRLLTAALEGAVRAVGAGDVRPVAHELHRVHMAKEATGAALREGTYRPPKGADRLERFHELDAAFHGKLERLVEASSRNDVAAVGEAVGAALRDCQGCHAEFRF